MRFLFVVMLSLVCVSCQSDKPPAAPSGSMPVIDLKSTAFRNGESIPRRYASEDDINPPLNWSGVPASARSIAILVEDADALTPQPFVHWLIYNIAPMTTSVPAGVGPNEKPEKPAGAMQGKNAALKLGFYRVDPPAGDKPHHYHFQIYALDNRIEHRRIGRNEFLQTIDGHVVAKGELVGTYKK